MDYHKLSKVLKVISWDAYPTWHDMDNDSQIAARLSFNHDVFRSLKGKPFLLMESTPSLTIGRKSEAPVKSFMAPLSIMLDMSIHAYSGRLPN